MGSITQVTIDFQTSHLVFPRLIGTILVLLGMAILATRHRQVMTAGAAWRRTLSEMDKPRFLGTIALTIVYFLLMEPVGNLWPNTGLGFLYCSIPFVFLAGLIFLHDRSLRTCIPLALVAVIVPTLVWWLFADVFFLTLP